mmetsp:Transcript_127496/g.231851  ORF Transcript_127496/g.231851 Transcript_127496/m.231851 type:complete len:400 (-) Transcript_127496:28-1227(-)
MMLRIISQLLLIWSCAWASLLDVDREDDAVSLLQISKLSTQASKIAKHSSLSSTIASPFSLDCNMTVDVKLRKIILYTREGALVVNQSGIVHNGKNIGHTPPTAQICRSNDTNASSQAMALFAMATTADYLFENKEGQWDNFINQHCYAKKHQKNMFLWIGAESEPILRQRLDQKDADAMPCGEFQPISNHHLKPLALAAILNRYRDMSAILTMDLDAWITAMHFDDDIETTFFQNSQADIISGAHSKVVLVNSGILGFKNNDFSRSFLAKWWKDRCGFKDQHSLWYNLLKVFEEEDPQFKWDRNKTLRYSDTRHYSPQVVGHHFPGFRSFAENGSLYEVAHLPHLDIYPNMGIHNMLGRCFNFSFFCHYKPGNLIFEPGNSKYQKDLAKSSRIDQRMC